MRHARLTLPLALLVPVAAVAGEERGPALDQTRVTAAVKRRLPPFKGCFLLRELGGGSWSVGGPLCRERLAPCSTFKIVSSLIALETGVASGPEMKLAWDGRKQPFRAWERDHTLRSAFQGSVVWYYQRLAGRVGRRRMRGFVRKLGYGNAQVTGPITRFWLDGSLAISPHEQLELLTALYRGKVPFADKNVAVVRGLVESTDPRPGFGGKTGSCRREGRDNVGWFVGHLRAGARELVFVTQIRGEREAWGPRARAITEQILGDLGLLGGQR